MMRSREACSAGYLRCLSGRVSFWIPIARVAQRLFGKSDAELKLLRSARRQQGLYQVYTDFCDSEQGTCSRCPLIRVLEA
jgi:hypothetical protein